MSEVIDTRLSYSSAVLLKNCSMKYWHYKVNGTPKDPDAEDNQEAFNVGKAFHWILEENLHTEENLDKLLSDACSAFEVEEHQAMIHAMILRYLQVHKKSGLKPVKCELGMSNDIFVGFIDAILSDEEGNWWISDLKTASRVSEIKLASLPTDMQLNLYSAFAEEMAGILDLDFNKWKGARYRVTTKARLKQKATEGYSEFVRRLAKSVKSYDVIIPKEKMRPKETWEEFQKLHERTMQLRGGEIAPEKNLSYCDSFFRPCEYFSQCHGTTCSQGIAKVSMLTSDNV